MNSNFEQTMSPQRDTNINSDVTMPGKRERKTDGRFEPGDLILGRYKVVAQLGQGGMGVVYKCFDETAGIEVALKALPPELSHNTLEMEDIKDNFQLVSKLIHQHIAISKNLEKDNSNGNYYLIMECVEGEDLRRWIRRKRKDGTLTLDAVIPVIRQIAEVLDYAHEEGVIHRDIKPGNIMINAEGKVKVLDFGLAAQIHTSMTRVSMAYHGTSGTGPYMAPEQWRGRAQGAPADQYALAVMTYEMLAGHLPFESSDAAVLKQAVLDENPEPLTTVPPSAQSAIARAMSKEPSERFACCLDFADALGGAKIKPMKNLRGRRSSRLKMLGLSLLAGVLLIGGGVYVYDRRQEEQAAILAEQKLREQERLSAEEAERKEAEENRKAEEKRIAEEKRLAEEKAREIAEAKATAERAQKELAEATRKAKEAEAKRLNTEAEKKRQSEAVARAEKERLEAEELKRKAKVVEEERKRMSEDEHNTHNPIEIAKRDAKEKGISFSVDWSVLKNYPNGLSENGPKDKFYIVPKCVTKIGFGAFDFTNLEEVTIPESVRKIGNGAFIGSELKKIEVPEGVMTIEGSAFFLCKDLTSVRLPKSLQTIGEGAFKDCEKLKTIKIPSGVTKIGGGAFPLHKDFSLEIEDGSKFYMKNGLLFRKGKWLCLLGVPGGNELQTLHIPEGVDSIERWALWDMSNLTQVKLPNTLKYIGARAFCGCINLKKVYVPRGVTIEDYAFEKDVEILYY